jgi:DNA-binding IscR family transcriptional regulator
MVCEAFQSGKRPPNDLEIAEALGCSSVVLRPTLAALERAGIIAHGSSRETPVMLLRSPESISLREVQKAVLGSRAAVQFPAVLSKLFAKITDTESDLSLAELVRTVPQDDPDEEDLAPVIKLDS